MYTKSPPPPNTHTQTLHTRTRTQFYTHEQTDTREHTTQTHKHIHIKKPHTHARTQTRASPPSIWKQLCELVNREGGQSVWSGEGWHACTTTNVYSHHCLSAGATNSCRQYLLSTQLSLLTCPIYNVAGARAELSGYHNPQVDSDDGGEEVHAWRRTTTAAATTRVARAASSPVAPDVVSIATTIVHNDRTNAHIFLDTCSTASHLFLTFISPPNPPLSLSLSLLFLPPNSFA